MRPADYLAGRFTYHDRARWKELIAEGRLVLNGARCAEVTAVRAGDEVAYTPHDFDEPPADLEYTIVYEDDRLLGIDKPGNLLVHRAGRSFRNNLMYQLRRGRRGTAYPRAGAINRLDRETSGLVLAAKDRDALRVFNRMFAGGAVRKEYVAIVHGLFAADRTTLEGAIGPDRESTLPWKHRVVDGDEGKPATTDILSVRPMGREYSLVRLSPRTGRTHQLRVHCAHCGHPIVGDRLYGPRESGFLSNVKTAGENNVFHRQALHCLAVSFHHPFTKRDIRIEAPPAADFQELQRTCIEND